MLVTGAPEKTSMNSKQALIRQASASLHHARDEQLDDQTQADDERGLLAGDADRESAEAQLRLAYTRGYLSDEALERRLTMAVAAEYQEDLRRLLADVPESQLELRRPSQVTQAPAIPPLEPLPQDIFIDDRPHAGCLLASRLLHFAAAEPILAAQPLVLLVLLTFVMFRYVI